MERVTEQRGSEAAGIAPSSIRGAEISRKTASSSAMASNELSTSPWSPGLGNQDNPIDLRRLLHHREIRQGVETQFGLVPEVGVDQDVIGVGPMRTARPRWRYAASAIHRG